MISDYDIPDVVPAGSMAERDQPSSACRAAWSCGPGGPVTPTPTRCSRPGKTRRSSCGTCSPSAAVTRRGPGSSACTSGGARDRRRMGHRPARRPALRLAGLHDVNLAGGTAEIMYWVLPDSRGGGIVVEAARRLSRWALDDLGLHRLRLCHAVANPASCRVAEKLGYAFEGTMRSSLLHADGWHDEHLHALVVERA
ncbi:GNAT family protein [Streptomyces diastatochromogenes]|nr:GNAT family protein [Streptomyces diastatochromogenes]